MKVRKAKGIDYEKMAIIHKEAFEGFFLSTLGVSFLETYYSSCLKSNCCVNIVGVDEQNEIHGFATGTLNPKGFHKKLVLNNLLRFTTTLIKIAFKSPKSIMRMYNNLEKNSDMKIHEDYAELLSIGLTIGCQGKGLGTKLLKSFEIIAAQNGAKRIILTTDSLHNENTIAFYEKNGYHILNKFISYPNRQMYRMLKNL